jgi:hypothetical protein
MPADVRSIAAVADWRTDLTNYHDMLAEAMSGINLELRRAYEWLDEQGARWKRAVRECEEEVVRAKAELAQRKFPTWDGREPDCTVQEKNLRLAKARLEHAHDQVEACRRWSGRLPKLIDELYTGPSRRLITMLELDVPNALAELGRRIASLESYAGLRPDYAPVPSTLGLPTAEPTPPAPLPEGTRGNSENASSESPEATESRSSSSPLPEGSGTGGMGHSEGS